MGESHTPTTDDICKAFVLCDSNVEVEAGSSSRVPFPRNPTMDEITADSGDENEIMRWFIDFWNDYEGRVRLGGSYKPSNTVFHEKYAKLLLGSILSFYKHYESSDSSNPIFDHFRSSLNCSIANVSTFFGAKTHSEDLKLPLEKKQTLMTMHDLAALLLQIASENEDTPANYERMISRELERSCQLRDTQYDPTNKKQELRRICQELPANFDKTTLYGRMALDCLATQTEKYKNEDQSANEIAVQVKSREPIPSMSEQGGQKNPEIKQAAAEPETINQFVPSFPEPSSPQRGGLRQRHPQHSLPPGNRDITERIPGAFPLQPTASIVKAIIPSTPKKRSTTSSVLSFLKTVVPPIFETIPVNKRQAPHPKSDRGYFGNHHDGLSGDEIFCATDPLLPKEKDSLTDKKNITEEACRDTDPLLPHAQYENRCS